jgi:hypothetical protein
MEAKVIRPMYDCGGRKYLDLEIKGQVQRVKVPWRYNRVMCHVDGGIRPVQDLEAGETVHVELVHKAWEGTTHFVLERIKISLKSYEHE